MVTDRPADRKAGRHKGRRSKGSPSNYTVWVPPGSNVLTSPGVRVVPIGERDTSKVERQRKAAGRAEPDPYLGTEATQSPLVGRKRKEPEPWLPTTEETADGWRQIVPRVRRPADKVPAGTGWRPPKGGFQSPGGPKLDQPDMGWRLSHERGPERRGWDVPLGVAQAPLGGDAWVPPEIEAMAQTVMAQYDMRVSGMHLITTKPDKGGAIWRIETDKGPRSLKLLHREPARSLFSVGAQEYLVKKGARVPALVVSKHGQPFHEIDGRMWIVTDWVEGLQPAAKVDLTGAQQLCYGLGEFHRHSQGYIPPAGAQISSRLRRWPKVYQKVLNKIGWFREVARAYPEMPASQTLLSVVDRFEQQAREAILRLERSPYASLVARGEPAWGIVHQHDRLQMLTESARLIYRKRWFWCLVPLTLHRTRLPSTFAGQQMTRAMAQPWTCS